VAVAAVGAAAGSVALLTELKEDKGACNTVRACAPAAGQIVCVPACVCMCAHVCFCMICTCLHMRTSVYKQIPGSDDDVRCDFYECVCVL